MSDKEIREIAHASVDIVAIVGCLIVGSVVFWQGNHEFGRGLCQGAGIVGAANAVMGMWKSRRHLPKENVP